MIIRQPKALEATLEAAPPGEERAEEYRTYYSLAHCERHARVLRREGSAGRYKIKFDCRSLKSYALLMPSPKA
jgi:hypothetical protein